MKIRILILTIIHLSCFYSVSLGETNNGRSTPYAICDLQKVQIYLVPLDDFPSDFAVQLARALSEDIGICVKGTIGMGTRGLVPFKDTTQYSAEDIVTMASSVIENLPEKQPRTFCVVLTKRDINENARNFRFLFAWHEKNKKISVVSAARMLLEVGGGPASNEKIFSRIYKMTKRSIGEQYFELTRSNDIQDVMYSPIMSLENLDAMGTSYLQLKDHSVIKKRTEELVQTTIDLIKNGDLEGLKPLYLLPTTYSKEEKQTELNGIIEALSLLSSEAGNVSDLKINTDPVQWYELVITGGDMVFQKDNSKFVQIVYRAEFSKIGPGFVILQITDDADDMPKLRGLGFALPANQQNEQLAQDIARKLMELMETKRKSKSI